jgi:hypothetical protein
MGETYKARPYSFLSGSLAAFGFDRAVYIFGKKVDNLLDEQEEYKDGEKIRYRKRYTVEQAIRKASENPNSPKEKFKGYAALFAGLG